MPLEHQSHVVFYTYATYTHEDYSIHGYVRCVQHKTYMYTYIHTRTHQKGGLLYQRSRKGRKTTRSWPIVALKPGCTAQTITVQWWAETGERTGSFVFDVSSVWTSHHLIYYVRPYVRDTCVLLASKQAVANMLCEMERLRPSMRGSTCKKSYITWCASPADSMCYMQYFSSIYLNFSIKHCLC